MNFLSEEEKKEQLILFNQTEVNYELSKTVVDLFGEQVQNNPQKLALSDGEQSLTYEELDQLSNQLAHCLVTDYGLKPNQHVGLKLDRGYQAIISILGVLKAGGTYVPIDPEYPTNRKAYILKQAEIELLITETTYLFDEEDFDGTVFAIDVEFEPNDHPGDTINNIRSSDDLAYLIYTSGSTGTPKGVMVGHSSLSNYLQWARSAYGTEESGMNFGLFTSLSFDLTVTSIYLPLISGGTLHCFDQALEITESLSEYFRANLNCIKLTPAHVQLLDGMELENSAVQTVILGGDVLTSEHINTLLRINPSMRIFNEYGPTESTVGCIVKEIADDDKKILIGKPIANTQIYILNGKGQLQPLGMTGEICIGGAGLAKGYWGMPELTAEKFVKSDFSEELIYKTGDLAKWLPDGSIDFVGRKDDQVKIKGYRIELGEIEHALINNDAITHSVLMLSEAEARQKELIAYFTATNDLNETDLRNFLGERLPDYMIPARFVQLEEFPLTPNGKIDKKALSTTQGTGLASGVEYIEPRNEAEQVLASVWMDVLKREKIGVKDSFYNLGGDSIKSIQVVARLKQHGFSLKVEHILKTPVLEDLAGKMEQSVQKIEQGEVTGNVELTPIQRWFFETDEVVDHNYYNQWVLLKSTRRIDTQALEKSVEALTVQHDALRMIYRPTDKGWEQINRPSDVKAWELQYHDLSTEYNPTESIEALGEKIQSQISLTEGPLFKVVHFKLKDDDRLGLIAHHLVVDGVSWRIIMEDLATLYEAYLNNEKPELPLKTDAFQNWASVQQAYATDQKLLKEIPFWKEITDQEQDQLPQDYELAGDEMFTIDSAESFILNKETTARLLTEVHGVYSTEINDILLAGLAQAINTTFSIRKTIIQMEGHGREQIAEGVDISRTVGWFTTHYLFSLDISETSNQIEGLVKVKDGLRAVPNKGIGYGILKYGNEQFANDTIVPNIRFNYLGDFGGQTDNSEVGLFEYAEESLGADSARENGLTNALLDVSGVMVNGELSMSIRFSGKRYQDETIRQFAAAYKASLTELIDILSDQQEALITPSDLSFKGLTFNEVSQLNADGNLEDVYELSHLQEGVYYYWLSQKSSTLYMGQASYRVYSKDLSIENVKSAYQRLVERHGVLRTSFSNDYSGQSLQIVKKNIPGNFIFEKIPQDTDWEEYLAQARQKDKEKGFDLSSGSQMRLYVIQLSAEAFEFIWSYHHVLIDGWCMSVLVSDFNALLSASSMGKELDLKPVTPYSEYINWLREVDQESALDFWKDYLQEYSTVSDLPFKTKNENAGYNELNEYIEIEGENLQQLNDFCAQNGITQNTFLQGVWGYLLSRYNGTNDVVFGAVVSGRPADLIGVEEMVGLFINTIPVRVQYQPNHTPVELLTEIQQGSIQSAPHHYLNLAEVQKQSEVGAGLINHLLVFENYVIKELDDESVLNTTDEKGLTVELSESFEENNYNLNLVVVPTPRSLIIDIRYNGNYYFEEAFQRLSTHFRNLIQAFIEKPEMALADFSYLTAGEEKEQLETFNNTEKSFPASNIIELFTEQVEKTPDALALESTTGRYTYNELNAVTNQLANCLVEQHEVGNGSIVGIKLDRDEWAIISMLAILKTGAAYVPIDPTYPTARKEHILDEAGVNLLITNTSYLFDEEEYDGHVFAVDVEFEASEFSDAKPDINVSGDDLAYVIYTSGSTGKPKGVMIEHDSFANYLLWARDHYSQGGVDLNFGLFTSIAFDLTITSLYLPLVSGGMLRTFDPALEVSTIIQNYFASDLKCVKLTPAHIGLLNQLDIESTQIEAAVVGGDRLEPGHIETLRKLNPEIRIYNEYGPTESTVGCTVKEIGFEESQVTIGSPIANTTILILDEEHQLLTKDAIGEICIGGAGLARGYLNQPDLTAEKFIQHPFKSGERLYKTGDLARWLADGEIEFLGRKDEQLKIKGYRIELGEIEQVLSQHNGTDSFAVLADETGEGEKELVAYVVPDRITSKTVHEVLDAKTPKTDFDADLYEMQNGVSLYAYNQSEVKMLFTEVFELKTYYKNGIRIPKNATIMDVGANVGSFSVFATIAFENPQIYAFEPLAPIYALLEQNVKLYGDNVKAINVGISDKEEEAVFDFYPYATVLSGRHSENYEVKDAVRKFIDNTHEAEKEEVTEEQMDELLKDRLMNKKYTCQLKSLSQVIRENNITHIDLLKIDAENAEMEIVNGIEDEDWEKIDQMVIEVYDDNNRLDKIKRILTEKGFDVAVYQSDELEGTKFYDVYCLREKEITEGEINADLDAEAWFGTNDLTQSIRESLKENLPDYMVPADIVLINEMPLTPNGKLDKKALLEIERVSLKKSVDHVAPRTIEEKVLVSVCEDVLKREPIGVKDNFYNLGGDSIKSIQVVARLKQRGYSLKVEHILRTPILEDLAEFLDKNVHEIDQSEVSGEVELTPIQQWFFQSKGIKKHAHFNQSVLLTSKVEINTENVRKSLDIITKQHDALRMTYSIKGESWIQTNKKSGTNNYQLDFHDLTNVENLLDEINRIGEKLQAGMKLGEGPLFKAIHFRTSDNDWLGLIAHHLVVDGVSWRILLEDLSNLYTAFEAGKTPDNPLKTDSFQKWALEQKKYANGTQITKERAYWEKITKTECASLPQDKKPAGAPGLIDSVKSFNLGTELTETLQTKVHSVYNTEINDILLTALGMALKETFALNKTMLKMEGHGREEILEGVDISRTVGWFTTTYPFVLEVAEEGDEIHNLIQVKDSIRAIPNKGIGYGILRYLSNPELEGTVNPEIVFNYLGDFGSSAGSKGHFEFSSETLGRDVAKENENDAILDISGLMAKGDLTISIGYSAHRYNENTIAGLLKAYQEKLESLVAKLAEKEQTHLTPSDLTFKGLTIHELGELNKDNNLEDVYELSPLQEGIYYHWFADPKSHVYFEQATYKVKGDQLDLSNIQKAFEGLVARHAILRTAFVNDYAGHILQVVRKEVSGNFKVEEQNERDLESIRKADRNRGFDLSNDALMRLTIIKLSDNEYEFIWSYHHILMDGWCMSLLINDFNALLGAAIHQLEPSLNPVTPYSTYIKWLKQLDKENSLNYWANYLEEYQQRATVPFKIASEDQTFNEAKVELKIEGDLFEGIKRFCSSADITQNTFVQGAWGYLLSRYNNTNDVVYGAVVSGRPAELKGVEEMVGLFINTIPVRVQYNPEDTPEKLLKSIQEESIQSASHHYMSLSTIQARSEMGSELIDHILLFENYAQKEIEEEGMLSASSADEISVEASQVFEQTNYDFNITINPKSDGLHIDFIINQNTYDVEKLEQLTEHFENVINAFVNAEDQSLGGIDYISKSEHQLLSEFNATKADFPDEKTIVELFEEQVTKSPNQKAVVFDQTVLSYQELNDKANQFSNYLIANHDIKVGNLVAINLERSEWMMVAIMGILKSGAAYVPMDPSYPQGRIELIRQDTDCKVIIDELALDQFKASLENYATEQSPVKSTSDDLAYVIYTSGSTGNPKGVQLGHKGLINRLNWAGRELGVSMTDVFLQKTPVTFDVSVWELFLPLIHGATLVVAIPDGHKDPAYLEQVFEQEKVSIVHFVPSMLNSVMEAISWNKLTSLRHVICSGEALSVKLESTFRENVPQSVLHNYYGPTEATIDVTRIDLTANPTRTHEVTIGKPVDNTTIYIVNESGSLQAVGVEGELLIGGVQLSKGYLNRPDLNAEKFSLYPHLSDQKLYHTGDLGKWMSDGTIAFSGRKDDQLKIKGYRIEPGEIVWAFEQNEAVSQAVVMAKSIEGLEEKQLVAYLHLNAPQSQDELREHLKNIIPLHMIPTYIIELDHIPLTANGKIDRKALPDPQTLSTGKATYSAPRNELEEQLVMIWENVLRKEKIGIDDNFFGLGGDSIKSIKVVVQIEKQTGKKLSVNQLFEFQTIAELAQELNANEGQNNTGQELEAGLAQIARIKNEIISESNESDLPSDYTDIYPLTAVEHGMIYSSLLRIEEPVYYDQFSFLVKIEELDQLKSAVNDLVERHAILRTQYYLDRFSQPVKVVLNEIEVPLIVTDISHLNEVDQREAINQFLQEDTELRYSFDGDLLWKMHFHKVNEDNYYVTWSLHHALLDGWSVTVFNTELSHLLSKSGDQTLVPLKHDYKDYCAIMLGRQVSDEINHYWKNYLDGYTRSKLPFNYKGTRISDELGMKTIIRYADEELVSDLENLANNHQLSFKAICLAAHLYLLHVVCSEEEVVTGVVTHERPGIEDSEKILGCFLNTVPVRMDFSELNSNLDLLNATNEYLREVKSKEIHLAGIAQIIDDQTTEGNPIFDTLLNYTDFHSLDDWDKSAGVTTEGTVSIEEGIVDSNQMTNTMFDLETDKTGDRLMIKIKYLPAYFYDLDMENALEFYRNILASFAKDTNAPISSSLLIAEDNHTEILQEFNATETAFSDNSTIHDLFETRVNFRPNSAALRHAGESMTYEMLNQKANQLAHFLIESGVSAGDNVGLITERGFDMMIGMYGILKAGGAYVPIDPSYPMDRQQYLIENSGVNSVIADTNYPLNETLSNVEFEVMEKLDLTHYPSTNPGIEVPVDQLAYTIYTSGSTGRPKGVMIQHNSAVNLIEWVNTTFEVGEKDRLLFITSMCFDLSVYDIFGVLAAGGTVVIGEQEDVQNIDRLKRLLVEERITFWDSVPTTMNYLIGELNHESEHFLQTDLRLVFMSGDWIPVQLPEEIKTFFPNAEVISLGGATEGTVWSNFYPIQTVGSSWSSIPYGKPIANNFFYILNENREVVPYGVTGELYIGGIGVARGYANDLVKTANAFVEDPFNKNLGGMMYRTGDLGRMLPDGNMEFLGRKDHQVKIRGYRVELGEIESALAKHPKLNTAVVNLITDSNQDNELCAYYVAGPEIGVEEIRAYLNDLLPRYMVPTHFMELDQLPLTSNGKINRKALPMPTEQQVHDTYMAPVTELEKSISTIWKSILNTDRMGLNDDFFENGANSLHVGAFINRVHKSTGRLLTIQEVFANPTIAEITLQLQEKQTKEFYEIQPVKEQEYYDLSDVQLRLWLLDQMDENQGSFNLGGQGEFPLDLDVALFQEAINELIERHEILRTVFVSNDGIPGQKVLMNQKFEITVHSENDLKEPEKGLTGTHFDLQKWPLFNAVLVKKEQAYQLFYSMHHIISDGWSMEIFQREVMVIYEAKLNGTPVKLPKLSIQYKDYALWQRSLLKKKMEHKQEAYWMEKLSGNLPAINLPEDRNAAIENAPRTGAVYATYLDEDLVQQIRKLQKRLKISQFAFFTAAFNIFLNRLTGETDLIVGIPVANRSHEQTKDLIGAFLNTLLVRNQLVATTSIESFLTDIHQGLVQDLENQAFPFERLIEKVELPRDENYRPSIPVFLNMLDFENSKSIEIEDFSPFSGKTGTTVQFNFECYFSNFSNGIQVRTVYDSSRYNPETIAYWISSYVEVIRQMLTDTEKPLNQIEVFQPLTKSINEPQLNITTQRFEESTLNESIIAAFEKQVDRNPENIAIYQGEKTINYTQLNERVNVVGRHLHTLQENKGEKVALLLSHGENAITGMLASLKSANAYVPIDPTYPIERILNILEDSKCDMVLTDKSTADLQEVIGQQLEHLQFCNIEELTGEITDNLQLSIDPNKEAYVLYTSGSTGKPKGVLQSHRNVLHFVKVYTNKLQINHQDVLSLIPNYCFDASVVDIYSALLNGAALHVYDVKNEGVENIPDSVNKGGVSILHVVPTIFRYFFANQQPDFGNVRAVVLGGEPVYSTDFELFADNFGDHAVLANLFGAAECSITFIRLFGKDFKPTSWKMPLGYPVSNTQVHLLDKNNNSVGIYEEGEMVYQSEGLSLGYYNNPEQTSAAFSMVPTIGEERLYHTGDIARKLPNGEFEFVGRKDDQIKINGQRVELSEIEIELRNTGKVREVAVCEQSFNDKSWLVAYVNLDESVETETLKHELAGKIPHFMIPTVFKRLEAFPTTSTGKIRKKDLPGLETADFEQSEYIKPERKIEQELAAIWEEVLDQKEIGVLDNFFMLGGDSIKALVLMNRINKAFNVKFSIADFLNKPNIRELAVGVEAAIAISRSKNEDQTFDNEILI